MKNEEMWNGIPRKDIPWFPTVDVSTCICCMTCYSNCPHEVYEMQDDLAVPVNPMSCVVGCSKCARNCPTEAITFPDQNILLKIVDEHMRYKIEHLETKKNESES